MADETRARYICRDCDMVEYCDRHLRAEYPPDATSRAFRKRHKATGCSGVPEYRCGITKAGYIKFGPMMGDNHA
jgi:hypothetical protein